MSRALRLSVEIEGSTLIGEGRAQFVSYQVRVVYKDCAWRLHKRYRQFATLNDDLAKIDALRVVQVSLPGRRYLSKLKQNSLSRRKEQLSAYLQSVIAAYMDMPVQARAVVRRFLEIPATITDTPSVAQPSWQSDDDLFDENDLEWEDGEGATLFVQLDHTGEDEHNRPTICVVNGSKQAEESFQYKPGTQLLEYAVTFQGMRNALANGDLRAVECILVQEPTLAQARNEQGNTPLHFAAMYNQLEIAIALVKRHRADLHAENNEGECCLAMALPEMRHSLEAMMEK